mmetsp:Transcript_11880/g.35070  ORF Transcript_11880/g.35070 Transcript_11880/m.35070 type:complete len:259 (-) Transcript_11880:898-1674(-)
MLRLRAEHMLLPYEARAPHGDDALTLQVLQQRRHLGHERLPFLKHEGARVVRPDVHHQHIPGAGTPGETVLDAFHRVKAPDAPPVNVDERKLSRHGQPDGLHVYAVLRRRRPRGVVLEIAHVKGLTVLEVLADVVRTCADRYTRPRGTRRAPFEHRIHLWIDLLKRRHARASLALRPSEHVQWLKELARNPVRLAWLAGHVEHKLPTVLNCRVSVEEEPVHGLFWLGEAWLAAGGLMVGVILSVVVRLHTVHWPCSLS